MARVLSWTRAAEAARGLVGPVLAVVFPSSCPSCGRLLARAAGGPVCEGCWSAITRWRTVSCRCGLPLLPEQSACAGCSGETVPFAAGASLGPYQGVLRLVLQELKYSGRRGAAGRLAALLLEDDSVRRLLETSDVLVPVPLHPRRLRQRGFNQSALVAAALGRALTRPVCADALVRRRETAPQAGLTAVERRRNVSGAFGVRRRARVAGRLVTLVDDVTTTGATVLACREALTSGAAREVRLLTVARA